MKCYLNSKKSSYQFTFLNDDICLKKITMKEKHTAVINSMFKTYSNMSISWIFIFYPNNSNYKQAQASSYNIHALSEPNSIIKGTMFSFKNRETSFHLVVAYLISSKAFLAFLSSSFIIRSSFTREYFFGSFRIRKMMSSTEILPGRPTSIAFFVCKTRRYMYLNL